MTNNELIAAQDSQRTQRNFISLLGGVFGADHSMADEDGYAVNSPGGYTVMAPYGVGGVALEGQAVSTTQRGGVVITMPMLLVAGALFLLWKH